MSAIEDKLKEIGLELPEALPPAGNYVSALRTGNYVYLSAMGPRMAHGPTITGKAGTEVTLEQAQEAAKLAALRVLSALKREIGDLDKVKQVVKIFGMVASDPDFDAYGTVMNGCSDLLVALYGDRGRGARTTMGVPHNPFNGTVSIDMIVEVEE